MAKPAVSRQPSMPPGVVCEPGRHENCLHAKLAHKRAKDGKR